MRGQVLPPRGAGAYPQAAGYGASGNGFYVWYETRVEAESWVREFGQPPPGKGAPSRRGARRRKRAAPRADGAPASGRSLRARSLPLPGAESSLEGRNALARSVQWPAFTKGDRP